jgi:hypothetical protein
MNSTAHYLSIQEVARRLTPADRTADTDKVYNWVRRGVTVAGKRVQLEAIRLPHGLAVTEQALQRFVDQLTRQEGLQSVGEQTPEQTPTPTASGVLPRFSAAERGTYPTQS